MNRNVCFRIRDEGVYEQVRLGLDAEWGHEPPVTCVDPASVAPRDSEGNILLAVRPEFMVFDAVVAILPGLLQSGALEEISEEEYMAEVS
jgi:hypothetical protein